MLPRSVWFCLGNWTRATWVRSMCFNHWTISFSLKSSKFICLYSTLYVFTNSSNGLSRPKFIFQNMFWMYSCWKSSADIVEFSYESSNSLNSTFAGIVLGWIDYWLLVNEISDSWKISVLDSYPSGHWFNSKSCKYDNWKGYIGK